MVGCFNWLLLGLYFLTGSEDGVRQDCRVCGIAQHESPCFDVRFHKAAPSAAVSLGALRDPQLHD